LFAEALHVTYSNPSRMALMTLVFGAVITACGSSGTGSPSATAAPVSTPTAAVASAKCNVLIELIANISPSYIAQFSGKFPVGFKSVSGVGDEARSFSQALGGGKDNEGVVATKGSTIVAIVATDPPASLTQIEALVNQLR
jgi:hypothetical protein